MRFRVRRAQCANAHPRITTLDVIERHTALPSDASSAAVARAFVRRALDDWDLGTIEATASLLATELVTNGLRHGGGPSSVALEVRGDRLWIAVSDADPGRLPRRQHRPLTAEGGRGLALIEAMADTWGTSRIRRRGGKVVWCELFLPGGNGAQPPDNA